jgi:Uma2 family endonuclease
MADPAKRRATYEDVLRAPKNMVAEILFGVLHTQPRPAVPHARATSRLGAKLGGPFDEGKGGPGGWIILDEPELHLGAEPDIVVPDLAGWRRERMPRVPMQETAIRLAPDWGCEVLSQSTQAIDRSDKMDIYAREAVAHLWLIDPIARTLEVYRLADKRWSRVATWRGDATVRAEPFDAIELELAALWAD